jgi:hypothetical protein
LEVRASGSRVAGNDLVAEEGHAVPEDPDLALFLAFPQQGGDPAFVRAVALAPGEQELLLVHSILQQETPCLVGEPAVHLPDREPSGSGFLVPVELRHLNTVSPLFVPRMRKNGKITLVPRAAWMG